MFAKSVNDYAVGKSKTDGDMEVINFTDMPYISYLNIL